MPQPHPSAYHRPYPSHRLQYMVDLQKTLRTLVRKNEELRMQVGACTSLAARL